MKKTVLLIVLGILVLFCLVAAGVAGFFGYRYYQDQKRQAAEEIAAFEGEDFGDFEAGSAWEEEPAEEQEPVESESPYESGEPQHEMGTGSHEEEAPPPRRAPPPSTPPEPSPEPRSQPPQTASAAPVVEEQTELRPPQPAEPAEPPKPKVPKGTFSLIFESEVDQGEVKVYVDDRLVERQPFTATKDRRFRLEKAERLLPGQHRVRIEVALPNGNSESESWTVMVVEKGNTIWKVEQEGFRKKLEIKRIPTS